MTATASRRVTRSTTRSQTSQSQSAAARTSAQRPKATKAAKKTTSTPRAQTSKSQEAKTLSTSKRKPRPKPNIQSSPTHLRGTFFLPSSSSEPNKTPVICHKWAHPSTLSSSNRPAPFVFTHGAGGTLDAPAVVNFCTGFARAGKRVLLAFQGSSNLAARVRGFGACKGYVRGKGSAKGMGDVVFGGRSMGARAAVMAAAEVIAGKTGDEVEVEVKAVKLVLVSYPLQGPKDVRDQILLDLPEGVEVLFVIGDKDAMCPLELLESVRKRMKAKSRVVIVREADHGMNVRPKKRTEEVGEEAGRVAARWLEGELEEDGNDGGMVIGKDEGE